MEANHREGSSDWREYDRHCIRLGVEVGHEGSREHCKGGKRPSLCADWNKSCGTMHDGKTRRYVIIGARNIIWYSCVA